MDIYVWNYAELDSCTGNSKRNDINMMDKCEVKVCTLFVEQWKVNTVNTDKVYEGKFWTWTSDDLTQTGWLIYSIIQLTIFLY